MGLVAGQASALQLDVETLREQCRQAPRHLFGTRRVTGQQRRTTAP